MKNIRNWPLGSAKLVHTIDDIPKPRKHIGELGGYHFFKTRHGEYAIKEENLPNDFS